MNKKALLLPKLIWGVYDNKGFGSIDENQGGAKESHCFTEKCQSDFIYINFAVWGKLWVGP